MASDLRIGGEILGYRLEHTVRRGGRQGAKDPEFHFDAALAAVSSY